MIGYLRGKVVEVHGNQVVLDVNGVGYLVGVSASVAARLQTTLLGQEEIALSIHTQVAENVLALFGFENREQMEFFQMLITVDGVGPKSAMAILGAGSLDDIKAAIASSNTDFFKKARGVGPATLRKISVDLAPKLKEQGVKPVRTGVEATVEQGLLGLGFKPEQVKAGLEAVDWTGKPDAQSAMQTALAALRR
jgi:Holliday junction DNA helicase RuvA